MATEAMTETIVPRTTAVQSIFKGRDRVGYSSRCDCGSREDHLFLIDAGLAYDKAERHARNHNCRKGAVPWAGHLNK
jgi:hypothetical protein